MKDRRSFLIFLLVLGVVLIFWWLNPLTPKANPGVEAVFAENLQIPWEIAFLPDGDVLITERTGVLKRIGENQESYNVQDVYHVGEGGLLGLTLHPDFAENRYLYLYLTYQENGNILNRVDRYVYTLEEGLTSRTAIIDSIPGARIHNGGRIAFGPDGYLYITTGDAAVTALSQDRESLAGKILRVDEEGAVPENNPFSSPVFSYGHRNPQGLAWDEQGRLWSTEHGPTGHDELNLIEKGKNYGWPEIIGDETRSGMETPVIHSGTGTWAPSGASYNNGSIFFAGLRGNGLYEAVIDPRTGEVKELHKHLDGEYGRLRNAVLGPDGKIYILTSNRDGRGNPRGNDDRIIIFVPENK